MQMERNTSSLNCTSTKTRRNDFPTRSNNFPSRPHPIVQEIDEHLCRLRSSEATSISSTSISQKLSGLQDLHDSVERLLQYQLPLTQQALAQAQNEKCTTEVLDGSLRPLDVCGSAKDALSQTKECVQDVQSIIRRRGVESGALTSKVKYLTSRTTVKRTINKAMSNLKGIEIQPISLNNHQETIAIVSKL
ncbi:hypothetical protein FF1_003573 [Malus domestica]